MSVNECFSNFVFHITILSPLADFIGANKDKDTKKNIRDAALVYLRGDYPYDIPAPEWINEVFHKATPEEIESIKNCTSVNAAYRRLVEIRSALVNRWAAKRTEEIASLARRKAAPKAKRRTKPRIYSDEFVASLIGKTFKEALASTGLRPVQLRGIMFNYGLKPGSYGGPIVKR